LNVALSIVQHTLLMAGNVPAHPQFTGCLVSLMANRRQSMYCIRVTCCQCCCAIIYPSVWSLSR